MPANGIPIDDNLTVENSRVFITVHNAMRIVKMIDPQLLVTLRGEIYDRSLPFFSVTEKQRFLGIKELLQDPVSFIDRYYDPVRVPKDTWHFVHPDTSPAYHTTTDCPRLHADYKNYRIPPKVSERGIEKVLEYRKWFQGHEELLRVDKAVFSEKMADAFGIEKSAVEEVFALNTGCEPFANYSLQDLKNKIETIIAEAHDYFASCSAHTTILSTFMTKAWLAFRPEPIAYNPTGYPDDAIKALLLEFLRMFKIPLQRALVEYYRLKYNPDITFQGLLLDRLGFVPCKTCR